MYSYQCYQMPWELLVRITRWEFTRWLKLAWYVNFQCLCLLFIYQVVHKLLIKGGLLVQETGGEYGEQLTACQGCKEYTKLRHMYYWSYKHMKIYSHERVFSIVCAATAICSAECIICWVSVLLLPGSMSQLCFQLSMHSLFMHALSLYFQLSVYTIFCPAEHMVCWTSVQHV